MMTILTGDRSDAVVMSWVPSLRERLR
jgi:hypothetical protein